MKSQIFQVFLLITCLASLYECVITVPLQPSEAYSNVAYIDPNFPFNFIFYWKLLGSSEIQFECHVRTLGWIGVGVSPNPNSMLSSDIFVGWIKSGQATLRDTLSDSRVRNAPRVDPSQDLTLLDAKEINGYTIIKFKRLLVTNDSNDLPIRSGSTYMIFSYDSNDPSGDNLSPADKHDFTATTSITLF